MPPKLHLDTKERLLRSAEELFVERGINAVSMREINRHAGQRNASSLHYHFVSRTKLVEALIDWRMPPVDARRLEMLERFEATPAAEKYRKLTEAIVLPLAETMFERNPPNRWIRLQARIYELDSFDFSAVFHGKGYNRGLLVVRQIQAELSPDLPQLVRDQRLMFAIRMSVYSLADWLRGVLRMQSMIIVDDLNIFLGNLLDVMQANLFAPITPFTLPPALWDGQGVPHTK
ncbi:TetR/AcrR family transcriptional regulator [Acidocella aminolytica]|jgi:AcrR family transcriptional regulator|uniref:HTH tetR-type domain-containing protein n=1 Tax=Acidocella aminolytica 101 = DSM 11237 TaxID=1120923 RepID=A0A0D6PBZ5_9PROT|nr:TetR/AcrR family transcriptional regulator [Acidocella aminolytica]GAN79172.1 hypothetical protein Aam_017_077 [Acidocella aminolytica 101 = DSM 11237]GBQ43616.1 TetR family transcriptional regulator [Acidocella aminolytica 101 = DSM 11237]SHE67537.1 transcriptional regulator, TetR family [Acidocella aminolytica 101 = DSM 11237]